MREPSPKALQHALALLPLLRGAAASFAGESDELEDIMANASDQVEMVCARAGVKPGCLEKKGARKPDLILLSERRRSA